ncbi:MAG: hypothetical protein R2710_30600 [Acidimicrobiales bacterium]
MPSDKCCALRGDGLCEPCTYRLDLCRLERLQRSGDRVDAGHLADKVTGLEEVDEFGVLRLKFRR